MASMPVIDIHPHIVSPDTGRYPPSPLFGIQSDWSKERPAVAEDLLSEMDKAGVAKTAIVHASTVYGYDNSLVADAVARFPARVTAVASIDMLSAGNVAEAERWIRQGISGFRIFTGGSTKKVDASELEDPRSFPVWQLCNERGLPICLQTDPTGFPAAESLARRFPNVPVILDHFARADASGGETYPKAAAFFKLAALPNIYLKFTPNTIQRVTANGAAISHFMSACVAEFGAGRIAWGSNWPNSPGTLKEILTTAKAAISHLPEHDRQAILGGTAMKLYPSLK